MTLKELGKQYLEGEKKLRKRLDELKEQLKTTRGNESRDALKARISALYLEALDAHRTGKMLINYYSEDEA